MINLTYSGDLEVILDTTMIGKVEALQAEISKHEQYEPLTNHTFHGGMYCREVWSAADVTIVGKVHKKEHFYLVASGTVVITTDDGVRRVTGPCLICSKPGTKRAIYIETDALFMTFHVVNAKTVEDAEIELVEIDFFSMFTIGNALKQNFIKE